MKLQDLSPVSNADYLLTITEITGVYWTTFSGVKFTRKGATFSDGSANLVRHTEGGLIEYQPITISKPHDPEKDASVFTFIKDYQYGKDFNFTATPVKRVTGASGSEDFKKGSKSWYFTGCRLNNWTCAEGIDTSDGSKAVMLSIEFTYETAENK